MSTTQLKRSLVAALDDAEAFRSLFPATCYDRWEIAGSVRRRKLDVSDIEHVVIPRIGTVPGNDLFAEPVTVNLLWHRTEELLPEKIIAQHVYRGEKGASHRWGEKYRGMDFRGFNHEVFCAVPDNWGSILAIRTGPAELSKEAVIGLQRFGYIARGGFIRNKSDWRCGCGWFGIEPEWIPVSEPEWIISPSGDYIRQTNPPSGPRCPRCRKCNGPEPTIVACRDEQTFFGMAGIPFEAPENRRVRP